MKKVYLEIDGELTPAPDGEFLTENEKVLIIKNGKTKTMSKTYNIILHFLAIIGLIMFLFSCNSERDKQRAEQKKITEAIERKIDSLQRIQQSDKLWRNQ
jgi:hypothetical protein